MNRFIVFGIVLALGVPSMASAELLFNPGFEDLSDVDTDPGDGWGSFGAAGFNAFFGANGHASFFMDADGNSGGVFQTGIAGTAGTEYQFELTDVLIESNAEANFRFGLEYYGVGDAIKLGETLVTLDLNSPNFIMTGTAIAGTEFIRPIILFDTAVGTPDGSENVFIFDASLTAVPEPGSLVLMGVGAALLLRRKPAA